MRLPLGIVLAEEPATPGGWADLGSVAAELEGVGAAGIWLTDHLCWHRPTADALGALHQVAAATSSCTLGPLVLQLPLRDAAATAKSLSYLEHLAPGRVRAGVGLGERIEEYAAAGKAEAFRRRGRLLDEAMDGLRARWSSTSDGWAMHPGGPVPLWVGGRSEAARHRAAVRGDAWIPHFVPAPWFAEQVQALAADVAAAGRGADAVAPAVGLAVHVDGVEPDTDPLAWMGRLYAIRPEAFGRMLIRGSAAHVVEQLAAYEAAGATHGALLVAGDQPAAHLAALIDAAA